ncbi:DUF2325 domain-containing protein [Azovibrio restrictus]|uniref:DUF2325 domain-containing protein n=1 Tax=Azovibrio restrictus TaxID=146938 RepID=UPI0026E9A14D|nr:DUF2325 domain-containing protein [Azovibrio restrictus]
MHSATPSRSSRRLKLWELEHKCHCPIIGVCFDLKRIRQLVAKVMITTPHTSDFEIHVTAVRECGSRNQLSELLQKELEKQYALTIQQFKQARTSAELASLWKDALSITDISGPLWATLTHPACTQELSHTVYGDIHMLQHQVGAGERADLAVLRRLQQEKGELLTARNQLQDKLTQLRQQHAREMEALKQQLAASREEAVRQQQSAARHLGELIQLKAFLQEKAIPVALSRRAQEAECRYTALRAHTTDLEHQLSALQRENAQLVLALAQRPQAVSTNAPRLETGEDILSGRSVLCVGGRTGAAHHYRKLVERLGGRFMHHDGGVEENLARLDGSIAAADAVICQAGCISHNAYWRVKELCKRTGKPCLYLKTPSLSTFARGLERLAQPLTDNTNPCFPEKSTP